MRRDWQPDERKPTPPAPKITKTHLPPPSRHWTPLWNEDDVDLINAAFTLENASPLVIELAVRLELSNNHLNKLENEDVSRTED